MGSPSADRSVQILDFLTTHPGRGYTLSELARQLAMNKATASRVLASLTDKGLLVRNADSLEYRLGPALIPMGAVAQRGFPALEHAKREAEALAAELDAECVILMPMGGELLVVGRAGVPGPTSFSTFEGQRHPLLPPLGTVFLAWRSDEAVDAWLDSAGDMLTTEERAFYRKVIAADRRRGYSFALSVPALFDLADLYAAGYPSTAEGRRTIRQAYGALAHDHRYLPIDDDVPPDAGLSSVVAPVFGPDGTMLFALCLLLLGDERFSGRDVPRLARSVVRAAGSITTATDGRRPAVNGNRVS